MTEITSVSYTEELDLVNVERYAGFDKNCFTRTLLVTSLIRCTNPLTTVIPTLTFEFIPNMPDVIRILGVK